MVLMSSVSVKVEWVLYFGLLEQWRHGGLNLRRGSFVPSIWRKMSFSSVHAFILRTRGPMYRALLGFQVEFWHMKLWNCIWKLCVLLNPNCFVHPSRRQIEHKCFLNQAPPSPHPQTHMKTKTKHVVFGTALSFGINDEWNILYKIRSVSIFDCHTPLSWLTHYCKQMQL